MNKESYCVYMHKNKTNGKIYIGQTIHNDNPEVRWGKNGIGYKNNNHFWSSIQKYGWDNFEHIILAKNLSKEEADKLEIYYIIKFNTQNDKFGYNIASGGHNGGFPHSEKTKQQIREKLIGTHLSEEHKQKIIDGLKEYYSKNEVWNKGLLHSEQTKQQISNSLKGRTPWNKGKITSKETKQKISNSNKGKTAWNKGKITPEETRKKISEANKGKEISLETRKKLSISSTGRTLSEETKKKISEANKGNTYCLGRFLSENTKQKISESKKGCKHMNNGKKSIMVKQDDIEYYKELGYVFGRLKTKK